MLARMAALPFLLFPAVLLLSATLAFANRKERRRLAAANLALAIVAALLIVNEVIAYRLRSSIRVDLLLALPALSLAAVAIGAITTKAVRGSVRMLAAVLAGSGGAALAVFGFFFVRTGLDAAKQTRQYFTGNRLYWEETIRCQGAMVERFGDLEREGDPCTGNLRVTSRTGGYPFTRIIVNSSRDVYLMFSPEAGVETLYGMEDTWPFAGAEATEGISAQGTAISGLLKIDLRRRSQGCEASITQPKTAPYMFQLAREHLAACPATPNAPVKLAGAWSTTEPLGAEHVRLVQLWLWTSSSESWAMIFDSTGVRAQERRFNFVKRFRVVPSTDGAYELRPYSNLDGDSSMTITLRAGTAHLELWEPRRAFVLDKPASLSHPKIRLAPIYDADRFAAYFDTVLRLVDIPWTPASSP